MTSEALEKYEVSNKWTARKRIRLIILGFVLVIVFAAFVFVMSSKEIQEEGIESIEEIEEEEDLGWDEDDYDDEDFNPDDDDYDY